MCSPFRAAPNCDEGFNMAEKTGITWCDSTINFWWGCVKISEGCKFCYAEIENRRYQRAGWGPDSERTWIVGAPALAKKLNKKAIAENRDIVVFSNSMADFFEDHKSLEKFRNEAWHIIKTNNRIKWLLLTKRSDNIIKMLPEDFFAGGYSHVNLGVTCESADYVYRLDDLRAVSEWGGIRWVSYEPAIGPIHDVVDLTGISWMIYGGESGRSLSGYRKDSDDWALGIKAKCDALGVDFFYKQNSGLSKNLSDKLLGKEYKKFPKFSLV